MLLLDRFLSKLLCLACYEFCVCRAIRPSKNANSVKIPNKKAEFIGYDELGARCMAFRRADRLYVAMQGLMAHGASNK